MEAAASIIAFIQLASVVTNVTVKYYVQVKDARKDIKRLENEINDLQSILRKIVDLIGDGADLHSPAAQNLPAISLILAKDGPLEACQAELSALAVRLEKADSGQGKGSMRQFGVRALKWPFSSKEIQGTMEVLERCKATFNLALSADHTKVALDTNRMVVDLNKNFSARRLEAKDYQKGEYRVRIIQWLATVEVGVNWSNHDDARKKHQAGTGEWLIEDPVFKQWKSTKGSVLWLYGIPGCGKTVLSSSVIEHLRDEYDAKDNAALSYFYFDFGTPAKQSVANCVRYILSRLTSKISEIPDELKDLYIKKCNYGNEDPPLDDLIAVLKLFSKLDGLDDIFVAIDALDECPSHRRSDLLSLLETISSWPDSKIHIFVTSRPESDIKETLTAITSMECIPIQGLAVAQDITHHIKTQMSCDPKFRRLPSNMKAEVERTLIHGSGGMFRWVDCQLDSLKRCKTKNQLLETLKTLPKTLDGTYQLILQNIPLESLDHARRALWWLVEARRPLTVDEVAEAAVLDPSHDIPFDPEARFFDPHEDILEILGSLVSVVQWDNATAPATPVSVGTIATTTIMGLSDQLRLSHFSVKEYLISERISQCTDDAVRSFYASQRLTDKFILQGCLEYIFHYSESDGMEGNEEDLNQFPLLRYACEYWCTYPEPSICSDRDVEEALLRLFTSDNVLNAWLLVYAPEQPRKHLFHQPDEHGQALHYTASLGLASISRRLLQEGADVNPRTESGITPLYRASEKGHLDVIDVLLEFGSDVNFATRGCRTPLHQASRSGQAHVLESLIKANADIEAKDVDLWTPLYWAAESGHEDIVRFFLQHSADPNTRTTSGGTALHQVCGRGNPDTARCLIDGGAEVNIATIWGRTPLHQAASVGALDVVNLLLDHGADPYVKDRSHCSPLELAEENGHWAVVDVLRALYPAEEEDQEDVSGDEESPTILGSE